MTVKNVLLLFCLLLVGTLSVSAQDQNDDGRVHGEKKRWKDTPTRYHSWGIQFGNRGDNDWNMDLRVGMLDLGFSSYLFDNSLNLPAELDDFDQTFGGSWNINLHLIRHRLPLIKRRFGIEYGLTIAWKQYRFANDFRFEEDTIPISLVDDGTEYKRNKLKTTFLEVPLMLTITPGRRGNFYLSGGVYGGLLLNAKQKLKPSDGGTIKVKDDFNLNKFRYGLSGRIGFGSFAVYGQVALNELFKEGQGPALTPVEFGITILDF